MVHSVATSIIRQLGMGSTSTTRACIIEFNDDAHVLLSLSSSSSALIGTLEEYQIVGSTNIGNALTLASTVLGPAISGEPSPVIVLLSDGEQSNRHGGSAAAISTAATVKQLGVHIFAMGFETISQSTLDQIASAPTDM